MSGKLAIASFVLALTCQVAVADVVADCRQGGPGIILRACTEIITSPSFGTDEKSLAYRYRGEVRTDAGEVKPAIADFTESIQLKKDNLFAFAGRGRAKFADGDLAGSIADYSEAISYLPGPAYPSVSSDLHVQRGHVYIVSNQLDNAINDLTDAIRLNPWNVQAFNDRGVAYIKKKDLDRAIDDYTSAIALSPIPQIYANRGSAYEAQSRPDLAIADLQYALMHDPSLVGARDALKRLGARVDAITKETDQRVRLGAVLAEKSCSSCHAVGTTDVSPNKDAVEFRNYYKKQPLFGLRAPITLAIRGTHGPTHFIAMKIVLSDEEINSIIAYINSLSTAKRLGSPE
jgi:tetratricopeptide (TPR) repeat protein